MSKTFSKAVNDFAKKSILDTDKVIKSQVIKLWNKIIVATPVGNSDIWKNPESAPAGYVGGRLRGNWFADINAFSSRST